jgi:hypothetical protein
MVEATAAAQELLEEVMTKFDIDSKFCAILYSQVISH